MWLSSPKICKCRAVGGGESGWRLLACWGRLRISYSQEAGVIKINMSCISPGLACLPYAMKYFSTLLHRNKIWTFLEEALKVKPGMKFFSPRFSYIDGHQSILNLTEVNCFMTTVWCLEWCNSYPFALGWNFKRRAHTTPTCIKMYC